jgi:hypothetical protein
VSYEPGTFLAYLTTLNSLANDMTVNNELGKFVEGSSLFQSNILAFTEHGGRVVLTASYSGDPKFKSRPIDWLS